MLKKLLFFAALLCCAHLIKAQNVFNPADPIVTYNSSSPAGSSTNPNQPPYYVMSKWVRTSRVGWNTSNFKCYIWNGMNFRMRFPNNYNPANATRYPVLVFYHGGGEVGGVYDNEDQLVWAAQLFEQRINNNEWNGFMIFPQEPTIGWNDYQFSRVNSVLDTLQKYNNADPDRVISMGLSSGGFGAVYYANLYPQRVAAALPSSPPQAVSLINNINDWVHVPVWVANGGTDANPDPFSMQQFYTGFRNAGGNIYQSYFVNDGHNTWTDMWNLKNSSGTYITDVYWANAHKAQPLVYFQNQQFCDNGPIAARMGLTPGFYAYEWQQDGVTIGGATGNEYTATQAGSYRARFMRVEGGVWSAWSPNPVVVSTKTCAVDTLFAEHFTNDNPYSSTTAYSNGNFTCQNGIMTSSTDLFTRDATGVQGSRFLINFTKSGSNCTYAAGDIVWASPNAIPVSPNSNYEYSFYVGSQNATSPAQLAPTINGTALISGYVTVTGTGNASWKKFTYTWNSGSATSATIGIINRSAVTSGNDFTIDEICFKTPPAQPVPNCTTNLLPANGATISTSSTATLTWTAAANAASYDVYLWTGATAPATPTANVTAASYGATGLTGSTVYNWYVVPKNSNGVGATGCINNKTSFTTAATPATPACVTNTSPTDGATLATTTTATLTWPAAATATSYDVYLWKGATAPATATATVSGTSYNATGLTPATVYSWYIVPKNAVGPATGCSANKTTFTTATGPVIGTGTGLQGDYYNTINLSGSIVISRTDATVNFNWGSGSPYLLIGANTFSARWTGFVQAQYSETYTFYTQSDDGVRLWVNGVQIINNWTDHNSTENSGTITLVAGVKYSIKMEYYDNSGNAVAKLSWSSPSTAKVIIPQKQLYTPANGNRLMATAVPDAPADITASTVNTTSNLVPTVFPNPISAGQNTTLKINSDNGGVAAVQVLGTTGNIMQSERLNVGPGTNIKTVYTANLKPGLYFIHVGGNVSKMTTLKLVVH